jgi:hypothetical protein
MKKIIYFLLLFTVQKALAQSTTILPGGMQNYIIKNNGGIGFEQTKYNSSFGTYLTSNSAYIQTNTAAGFSIGSLDENPIGFNFFSNGNVLSNNWLKLGSDAPEMYLETYTGTTSSAIGGITNVAFLNPTNVISASIIVDCGAAGYVTDNYSFTDGYQVQFTIEDTNIKVRNVLSNSYNILSKPFKLMVTIKK